jgi:hypothetical protein
MHWFQYLIAPAIAAILTAVLNTYLTAHFSFRRFRREQWWQAKREAYESIIRKLAEIMFDNHSEYTRFLTGGAIVPRTAPDREKQLTWNIQEIASGGAYIVSDRTVATVQALLKALDAPWDGSGDNFKACYDAASKALEVVKAEAHRDLGVEG